MAKKIIQFRYFGDNDDRNFPVNATSEEYVDGSIFKRDDLNVFPISQLGIQALPGTKVYLNGSSYYLLVGSSGIYDLDITNGARITNLGFGKDSMERIKNSDFSYLLVDILYGED